MSAIVTWNAKLFQFVIVASSVWYCPPGSDGLYRFQLSFYAPQLVPPGTAEARISYGNSVSPSVCLSVRLSRPGGIPSTGEIETPGLHHMVAWSI